MADVTVTVTDLAPNVASTDLVGSGSAFTTGQTGVVSTYRATHPYLSGEERLRFIIEETGGTTGSVVFDAGDYPPSSLKDKGTLTVTLAANDLKELILEAGRFLQDDGTISWTFTGTGRVRVIRDLPREA